MQICSAYSHIVAKEITFENPKTKDLPPPPLFEKSFLSYYSVILFIHSLINFLFFLNAVNY